MNDNFIKSLYESIVKENIEIYKDLFNNTIVDKRSNDYWKKSLSLYNGLSDENKKILFNIIEQTMIDTMSNMLGVIDGNVTLNNCDIVPKLFLDSSDTEGELQDLFLAYIEEFDK